MAGLCWMAVMLAFFLSTENSFAAVDQNRLATIVNGILKVYGTQGMFSLAVSIPDDQNRNIYDILQQVFQSDPVEDVAKQLGENKVYVGNRVVAARPLPRDTGGADHAESRVADYLVYLFNHRDENDLLLFYVYASPCVEKCTRNSHPESILGKINQIQQWKSHAFVFSKIFKPRNRPGNTVEELSGAIGRLGSVVGLDNIFRCDKQNGRMECISCSSNNRVSQACVSDTNTQPQQGQVGSGVGGGRGRGQGGSGRGGGRGGGQGGSGRGGGRGGGQGGSGRGGGRGGGQGGSGRGGGRGGGGGGIRVRRG